MDKHVSLDVPIQKQDEFLKNFNKATDGSGRLMLFAGDQKVEHLNHDFYGKNISIDDNDPEHLFKIASKANIGVFATQFGLISHYARNYSDISYLVKLNSKTNIMPYSEADPYSKNWFNISDVVSLQQQNNINILGVGYTVYLGGRYEAQMLSEAARIVHDAHQNGLIVVLWIYPKGKHIKDEHDANLIAGAAGVGVALGADFVKLKVPYTDDKLDTQLLKIVTKAAGRTGVLCEGGGKIDEEEFLQELYTQIHVGNSRGNGTGRNIHQRPLNEAIKMANAIYAITVKNSSVEDAIKILKD